MPDMKIASLLCDRQSFIPSRAPLEDNAMVLMHYENGAVGRMWASAINAGAMDSQSIRVVGSRASLQWSDSTPGELRYEIQAAQPNAAPRHALSGRQRLAEERLGALHTEGLAESRANIYLKFAIAISASQRGDRQTLAALIHPDIDAGLEGVRWIENCVRSADNGATG